MKYILVPTSQEAMIRLDSDECIEGDLIEAVINDEQFNKLFHSGLIDFVNKQFDVLIDEYEDAKITNIDDLKTLSLFLEQKFSGGDEVFSVLKKQVAYAIKYNTGVFFFF